MIVTKIEQQKRHPERVNLYLDGEFALGLHMEIVAKFGLRRGDIIPQDMLDKITLMEEFSLAKHKALRFINYRLRSEKELRSKLLEKEFHPCTIDQVIDNLKSLGLINDLEFARAFIHDAQLHKPAGRQLLQRQLMLKGISLSLIRTVLDENFDNEEESMLALAAAKKHLKRYTSSRKKIDPLVQQHRLTQFLARRGFRWSTILPIMKKLFKNQEFNLKED